MEYGKLLNTDSFVKNSFWNGLVILLARIGGMFFVIILARFLLPEKFGIYMLSLSIPVILISLTSVAINQTGSRYMSDSFKSNDLSLVGSYFKFCFKAKIFFALITFFTLLIIAYPLSMYIFKKPDLFYPLLLFSLYIIILPIQQFYETIFYIVGKVNFLTIKETLLQSLKLASCIFFFLFVSVSINLAIISIIFSSLIATFFLHYRLKKDYPFLFQKEDKTFDKKRIKKFIKQSIFYSIFSTLFENLDILFLGIFVTSAYVGYYSVAFTIVGGLYGLISLSNLSLPLFTQADPVKTKKIFESMFKYLSIISLFIISGVVLWGKEMLILLYGASYQEATLPLIFLSLLIFEFSITENLKAFLLSKEKPEVITRIMAICTGANLLLNLILVPILSPISMFLAVIGVVICLIISRFMLLTFFLRYLKKTFNIFYSIRSLIKPIVSSIFMILSVLLIKAIIREGGLLLLILEIVTGTLIYLLTILLCNGIKKEDFSFLKNSSNKNS